MVNPYPPNPGMPPMGPMPPQMQRPPHGPNVVRRGTSRAVPIVVSAGLAVGVFCGLLFGLGTGEDASAGPSTGNNVKAADPSETTPTPSTGTASTSSKPSVPTAATITPTPGTPTPGTPTPGTPTPGTPAAGSGSGATAVTAPTVPTPSAGSAQPALKKVKLVVEIKPDAVAAIAKITVDKQDLSGGTMEVEIPDNGKKDVKVVVKAPGYKTVEQTVEVEGDVTVKVELIKRPGGGPGGATPPRPGGGKPKPPPGGGLIDI